MEAVQEGRDSCCVIPSSESYKIPLIFCMCLWEHVHDPVSKTHKQLTVTMTDGETCFFLSK